MLSTSYKPTICATPSRNPHDIYCPILYLRIHAVPSSLHVMLISLTYDAWCPSRDPTILSQSYQISLPHDAYCPISLPLDTCMLFHLPQDVCCQISLRRNMQRNQPAAQIAARHTIFFFRWRHKSDESDGAGGIVGTDPTGGNWSCVLSSI